MINIYKEPKPEDRYPLGYVDYEYVRKMELLNDDLWKDKEKWYYYNREHQNLIIPIAVLCFLMFFGAHPFVSITMIILTICVVLYMCYLDNKKMNWNPWIQESRKRIREFRRDYLNMDV